MNRLVIIGNGFNMAHGLKTSYMDFINWYWDQRVASFAGNTTKVSEDILCTLTIKDNADFQCIKSHPQDFALECSPFFKTI